MYVVMELQRTSENTLSTIVTTHETRNDAEWKYHQILAAAAISQVDIHSAVMLGETGQRIKGESYVHMDNNGAEVEINE